MIITTELHLTLYSILNKHDTIFRHIYTTRFHSLLKILHKNPYLIIITGYTKLVNNNMNKLLPSPLSMIFLISRYGSDIFFSYITSSDTQSTSGASPEF